MVTVYKDSSSILDNLQVHAEDESFEFQRIYRLLYQKDLYYKALSKLYKNKGIGTPGVDGQTIDGVCDAQLDRIIETLRDESYQPLPVKRTYIPKKHGNKLRPLGLPAFTDKVIQEIVRVILDIIFDPCFSENSHGFREKLSCHTALNQVRRNFTGVNWFIEGDIKGAFDNIDHHVLIDILRKKIKDERFINLIWKFLKAGYLEEWQYHKTYSGCPQGGIISPVLCNIYLNELDKHVEELKEAFDKGKTADRKVTAEYKELTKQMKTLKKEIENQTDEEIREQRIQEYKQTRKARLQTPRLLPNQGEVRRIQYVRYADDWLVGVIGSKEDCENIKADIESFLRDKLKLELSKEKTLITHSSKPAKLLGFDIWVRRSNSYKKDKNGVFRRVHNGKVVLSIPEGTIERFISDKKMVADINAEHWMPTSRGSLLRLSDLEIIRLYNSELRGLYQYYRIAENVSTVMNNLSYVMEYSCLKTLARKHNISLKKFRTKHRAGKGWGITYQIGQEKKTEVFYNKGFKKQKPSKDPSIDRKSRNEIYFGKPSELERRLKGTICELCGAKDVSLECHHVNKMKNLKGKAFWERVMIGKRRKTLMVCHDCHVKIHNGTYD